MVGLLSIGQLVATAAVYATDASSLSSSSAEPTITPAGYAFVIWSIPVLGCPVYAAYAFTRSATEPYRSIGWPLAITMAGFSVWLWLAVRGWVWATVPVFALMLLGLALALRATLRHPPQTKAGRFIVTTVLGVYAGWTTVAVWANTAAALHTDPTTYANTRVGWQLTLLIGAAASSVVGVWLARAMTAYVGAILWALVGVIVATVQRGAPGLTVTASLATAAVAATAAARRINLRGQRRRNFTS